MNVQGEQMFSVFKLKQEDHGSLYDAAYIRHGEPMSDIYLHVTVWKNNPMAAFSPRRWDIDDQSRWFEGRAMLKGQSEESAPNDQRHDETVS